MTKLYKPKRFAITLICLSLALGIASAIAGTVNLDADSCGYFADNNGDVTTSSTSPDHIEIRAIADGVTISWGLGKIKSELSETLSNVTYSQVRGRSRYHLKCQCSKENASDSVYVRLWTVLYSDVEGNLDKTRRNPDVTSDSDITENLDSQNMDFPDEPSKFRVTLEGQAYAKGTDTGSYSETTFYGGSLELEAVQFYVIVV